MDLIDESEFKIKALPLSNLVDFYYKGYLDHEKTENIAAQLKRKGYGLTKDDLNKMRQFMVKIAAFDKTFIEAIMRQIAQKLPNKETKFTSEEAEQLSQVNSINYRISKTAMTKYQMLLIKKKIIIDN